MHKSVHFSCHGNVFQGTYRLDTRGTGEKVRLTILVADPTPTLEDLTPATPDERIDFHLEDGGVVRGYVANYTMPRTLDVTGRLIKK